MRVSEPSVKIKKNYYVYCVDIMIDITCIFSGGTLVTVSGLHLDSVAEPRIGLTVVVTKVDNSSMPSTFSNFEVLIQPF